MSVLLGMKSVSDENAEIILKDPELILNLVDPEDPIIQSAYAPRKVSFLSRLLGKRKETQVDLVQPMTGLKDQAFLEVDLDKVWYGLHFCLTGDIGEGNHELGFLMYGGALVGDVDLGYGPGRIFTSSEVKTLSQKLTQIEVDALKRNFDPEKMDDVYPSNWREDDFEYVLEYFEKASSYVEKLSEKDLGMIVYFF